MELKILELYPFYLSFKLALLTTVTLFVVSLPLAWWLSQSRSRWKPVVETVSALPIVLPPSVIGFYILVTLSQNSPVGKFIEDTFGIELLFNFTGILIASLFYSLPFMVQPLQSGFESLNRGMVEASYIAGKGSLETLFRVAIPNIKPSIITALVITFAHTVGEFGVVLMVGGSIEGETRVASVAIYEAVELMDYSLAHLYSGIMVLISFFTLLSVYIFNGKRVKQW
jgi:molybdate transport system permease protein